jgi:hypothetical protein
MDLEIRRHRERDVLMKKPVTPAIKQGLLALLLAGAAGACHAQTGARVGLSAEAGAKSSIAIATLEEYPTRPEIGQVKDVGITFAPALQFLKSYYQAGRAGNRDQMVKLFAPEMQADIGARFTDSNAVKAVFADLGKVEMDAAVAWGHYRIVLVNHGSKANPQQAYPWPHAIACPSACMFVQEPQVAQVASYLLYLTKYGKQNPSAAPAGSLKLALHPLFPGRAPTPALLSNPVELNLVEADAAAKAAGAALLAKLLKYPDAGPTLAEAERALFDGATPRGYPRKAGNGNTTDMVAWPAYLERVRSKSWTPGHTFRLRADTAILIARSADDDLLFLPFHQTGNGWRLFSSASDAPFMPLFAGMPFADSFGKLLKKP